MPYLKVWIHLVWATKNRQPFLNQQIRQSVFNHIRGNAFEKDIYLDCINGHHDHVHCLISLNANQTIANVMQLIKGESSNWINKEKIIIEKFQWQSEYFAVSVSHSQIDVVRNYINNQEEHHRNRSFQEEVDEFISKYGFEKLNG